MNKVQQSIVLATFIIVIPSIFLLTLGNYAFAIDYTNYTSTKLAVQFEYPTDWTVTEKKI